MRIRQKLSFIVLCGGLFVAGPGFAENQKLSSVNKTATPVIPAQSGAWQLFWLPRAWVVKHLPSKKLNNVSLTVKSPYYGDLNQYWPCSAPPRLMVGLYFSDGTVKERLHSCFDYCGPNDKPGNMLKGLWGPDSKLVNMEVSLQDGKIILQEHYSNKREQAEIIKNPGTSKQIEIRKWQRSVSPAQLLELHDTRACQDL